MPHDNPLALHHDLMDDMFHALGLNESIYLLFRFILKRVPSVRVLCYSIDRTRKLMNVLVDYNTNSSGAPFTQKINKVFDMDYLYGIMDNTDFTFIENNIMDAGSDIREYVAQNFSAAYASTMGMYLDIDARKDSLFVIMLASLKPENYTDEHREILFSLRSVMQELLGRFILSSDEPCLVLSDQGQAHATSEALLRRCPGLAHVMRKVDIVAGQRSTVVLHGASGTGKELVAETIHSLSPRKDAPMVKVNCGAIPPSLMDSELFGHEKGAFTGAMSSHPGYFEQAQGGTLYLDEVGELDLSAQVRLLRVLESREVRRVGGNRRIPLDVRIIAASHRDLWAMTEQGTFREDLWYRLHVYPIEIPSLRHRLEDIPVLAEHFYHFFVQEHGLISPPSLTRNFVLELAARDWPGNVRQFRHVMERAFLESMGTGTQGSTSGGGSGGTSGFLRMAEQDRAIAPQGRKIGKLDKAATMAREIEAALEQTKGKIQGKDGAAVQLGISPSTMRSRMKALGIPLPRQRRKGVV